jgi:tRNA G18 (ribose-2'-O)-methylase SpoU
MPSLTLLLYGLQSPANIGMILRVAETYRVGVAIHGSESVLDNPEKLRTVEDFACGAVERVGFRRTAAAADLEPLRAGGRLVAASLDPRSRAVWDFGFEPGDVVVLGNEYDGLPESVARDCAASVHIPMPDVWTPKPRSSDPIDPTRTTPVARDGRPNLNVAIAGGIVCYQWFQSCGQAMERASRLASAT